MLRPPRRAGPFRSARAGRRKRRGLSESRARLRMLPARTRTARRSVPRRPRARPAARPAHEPRRAQPASSCAAARGGDELARRPRPSFRSTATRRREPRASTETSRPRPRWWRRPIPRACARSGAVARTAETARRPAPSRSTARSPSRRSGTRSDRRSAEAQSSSGPNLIVRLPTIGSSGSPLRSFAEPAGSIGFGPTAASGRAHS